jgi:hypothetical protein
MSAFEQAPIVLPGGLAVCFPALRLVWGLEERGLRLRAEGDTIVVSPRGRLSEDERAGLRRYRADVLALIRYDADSPDGQDAEVPHARRLPL